MKLFGETFGMWIMLVIGCLIYLFCVNMVFLDTGQQSRLSAVFNDINGFKGDPEDYCDGELFAYRHLALRGMKVFLQKGQPFNCSLMRYLEEFKLTAKYTINETGSSKYPDDLVFLTGVNDKYFPTMQISFSHLRKHFGYKYKIILYDLGGLNATRGPEIAKMCNVELRTFNFSRFPAHVQFLRHFSWKILILAEVFNEANTIMYLDTSVNLNSTEYYQFFEQMARFKLLPVLMLSNTRHSIDFATSELMHYYLPLDLNYKKGTQMTEANFLLIHKSEPTRQLLKWAVLCASTLDCIQPPNTTIRCNMTRMAESSICNRQDQSVFNILTYNMERELKYQGYGTILSTDSEHPHNIKDKGHLFKVERRQKPKTPINLECDYNGTATGVSESQKISNSHSRPFKKSTPTPSNFFHSNLTLTLTPTPSNFFHSNLTPTLTPFY